MTNGGGAATIGGIKVGALSLALADFDTNNGGSSAVGLRFLGGVPPPSPKMLEVYCEDYNIFIKRLGSFDCCWDVLILQYKVSMPITTLLMQYQRSKSTLAPIVELKPQNKITIKQWILICY